MIENLVKRLNKRGLTFKYSIGLFARSVNPFRFKELPSYKFKSCKIPEMKSPSVTVPNRVIPSSCPIAYSSNSGKIAVIAALREVSILFASIYGIFILKERGGYLALISAILILLGCVVIKIFE